MLKLKTNQTGLNYVKNVLNRQPIVNTAFLWLFEVIELWFSSIKYSQPIQKMSITSDAVVCVCVCVCVCVPINCFTLDCLI